MKEEYLILLSKEQFINAINDVENVCRYQEGLNNYFRKNNVDGYIFQPDCSSTVIGLLHTVLGEKDKDEWIRVKNTHEAIISKEIFKNIFKNTPQESFPISNK